MNYYKITDESLSADIRKYAEEAAAADYAADALAAEIGADSFVPSPYGEFGGVMACTFPGDKAPHFFRFAEEDDGYRYYEPAVQIADSVETDGFMRGLERRQNSRNWFEVHELSLAQTKNMITHARALELAKIRWDGTNITKVATRYRLSPSWMELYYQGRMDYAILCSKSRGHALTLAMKPVFDAELREAMTLEYLLDAKLSKSKFYKVRHVSGSRDAVRFFRRAAELPLIPSGRLADLLGVVFVGGEVSCPAFFYSRGNWYVATSGTIAGDKTEEISEVEYKSAEMWRGEN